MTNKETKRKLKDANFCIGTGVGVGLLGAGSAAVMGVVCPLCIFIPPVLVGAGLVQRIRVKKGAGLPNPKAGPDCPDSDDSTLE